MKKNLAFDFSVDRERNLINIKKEFVADGDLIWKAWTTQEWLDQWWGPQPWQVKTKILDFTSNGIWLYAMISPEGAKHWSISQYISIMNKSSFTMRDGFCDENGSINKDLPQSIWTVSFNPLDKNILVNCEIKHDKSEELEAILNMGFQEGITQCMEQLDELVQNKNIAKKT